MKVIDVERPLLEHQAPVVVLRSDNVRTAALLVHMQDKESTRRSGTDC